MWTLLLENILNCRVRPIKKCSKTPCKAYPSKVEDIGVSWFPRIDFIFGDGVPNHLSKKCTDFSAFRWSLMPGANLFGNPKCWLILLLLQTRAKNTSPFFRYFLDVCSSKSVDLGDLCENRDHLEWNFVENCPHHSAMRLEWFCMSEKFSACTLNRWSWGEYGAPKTGKMGFHKMHVRVSRRQ